MKFDQLLYFLEASKTQHFGKAAKSLHITPSAVSHAITALEDELSCQLFLRSKQRVFLTDQGKRLAELALPFFSELQTIKDKMASSEASLSGTVRFAGTHGYACNLISEAWASIVSQHTNLTGEIYSLRSGEILRKIQSRELDIGLCYAPQASSEYFKKVIAKIPLWVTVKKDHPLMKLPSEKRLSSLNQFPFAAPKPFAGIEDCYVHPLLVQLGVTIQAKYIYDNYGAACSFLKHSLFWSLLPEFVLEG